MIQGKLSNYDTDAFTPILDAIGERAGVNYRATIDDPSDVSMRVIADHLRAMTFLIADGVMPSNEWRGYVLRKIMRRAMRHGKKLGFREPLLHTLVDVIVREVGGAYPELKTNRDTVVRVVRSEEERFDAVLTAGLPRLEESLDRAAASGGRMSADDAFRLYDSLGVPLDFMEDLASQRQISDRPRGLRTRDGRPARQGARRQHVQGRGKGARPVDVPGARARARASRRYVRGIRGHLGGGGADCCALRRGGPLVRRAACGREGLRRTCQDAFLRRSRRPGVGHRAHRRARMGRRPSSSASFVKGPTGRGCIWCASRTGSLRRGQIVTAEVARRRARCDTPKSHGDASPSRGASPGARHARQAGGLAGGSGPVAVRFRTLCRDPARPDRADRTHRERADLPQHAGADRCALDRRGDCRRCNGALR